MSAIASSAIAALNDAFRRAGPRQDWYMSAGVHARGPAFVAAVVNAVRGFDAFSDDADPFGEHDFGSVTVAGVRVWFKIEYYNAALTAGSSDPTNPAATRRTLTVLLPQEY